MVLTDTANGPTVIERLRRAEERNLLLSDGLTDHVVLTLDLKGRLIHWNAAALRILGYSKDEMKDLSFASLFSPEERIEALPHWLLGTAETEGDARLTHWHARKDGSKFRAESLITALKEEDGSLRGFVQLFRDTSDGKKVEEELHLKEQRNLLMLENIQDYAIFMLDLEGRVSSWSKGAERVKGYTSEEVIGKHFRIFYTQEEIDLEQPEREIQQAIAFGRSENEYWRIKKNGERFWGNEIITSLRDEDGVLKGFVKVTRDMTERKNAEELIRHQAFHDPLTNLPNRRLGEEWLSHAMAKAERAGEMIAVLICDLDRFKAINDTYGHPVGDLVLKEVSRRLLLCLRKEDMVVRLGGDEFLLFLPEIQEKQDVEKVVGSLLAVLQKPMLLSGNELQVGVSLGIAFCPVDGSTAESLIKAADMALYQAKKLGSNNFQIYTHSRRHVEDRRRIMGKGIRAAIKNGEFELYYQPIVDIAQGRAVQQEALIRWVNPVHGLMFPDEFMPLVEEEGLTLSLGWWVVEAACKQITAWQKAGFDFGQISFNCSALQFSEMDMPMKLRTLLKKLKVEPSLLQMEIIENSVIQDVAVNVERLRLLREMGMHVAIDDFGTGYSSLSYLLQLPLERLKIDKSFLKSAVESPRHTALIKMIVELGHALDLKVCAEGVETAEQLALLSSLGCDLAQGFLMGYPVPAAELVARKAVY